MCLHVRLAVLFRCREQHDARQDLDGGGGVVSVDGLNLGRSAEVPCVDQVACGVVKRYRRRKILVCTGFDLLNGQCGSLGRDSSAWCTTTGNIDGQIFRESHQNINSADVPFVSHVIQAAIS